MLTDKQLQDIEKLGIIPDALLDEYLDGKLLIAPKKTMTELGDEETRFETMYAEYKANQKKAQKASFKANGR